MEVKNKTITLSQMNENKTLLNFLKSCYIEDKIQNKLWKCFITNDGSMTKILKILYGENLNLKVISHNFCGESNENMEVLGQIEKMLNLKAYIINPIERKINFLNNKDVVMLGLSYWDANVYSKIYANEEDQDKAIGLIFIEKEIEYYKSITNYTSIEYKNLLVRISYYKIEKRIAFVLVELFDTNLFEGFFGNLE